MATDPKGRDGPSKSPPDPTQPVIAGVAAWVLPGLGYWIIGQRARGVTVCITVITLFLLGLLIGGIRVLEVPTYDRNGSKVVTTYDQNGKIIVDGDLLTEVRAKPWSMAQIMTGPIGIVAGMVSVKEALNATESHARVNEIAVLYTAVAGMLNLLAIIDTVHRAVQLQEGA